MEHAQPTGAVRIRGHLPELDGVRGLAILLVMGLHFVGDQPARTFLQRIVVKAATFGNLGVDLFFVLSGFLITGLLLDTKGRPRYFRNFYARRTLRIFPLYYFVLTVLFLVLPLFVTLPAGLERAREHQIWLWTYTTNFYVAAQASWNALSYMTHFWSLAVEEHFYLIWPLLVFALRRDALVRVCIAALVGGLALRIVLALSGMSELSISVLTPCRVDTLCLGGLLALLVRDERGPEWLVMRAGRAALVVGLVIVALSTWCATLKLFLPVLHQVRASLYALFFGALSVASLLQGSATSRVFRSAVLRFFGKYSYGLYVYHGLLTWYLNDCGAWGRLDEAVGNHALSMTVGAVAASSVSVAVAVASYQLFEKPFLSFKRFFESGVA